MRRVADVQICVPNERGEAVVGAGSGSPGSGGKSLRSKLAGAARRFSPLNHRKSNTSSPPTSIGLSGPLNVLAIVESGPVSSRTRSHGHKRVFATAKLGAKADSTADHAADEAAEIAELRALLASGPPSERARMPPGESRVLRRQRHELTYDELAEELHQALTSGDMVKVRPLWLRFRDLGSCDRAAVAKEYLSRAAFQVGGHAPPPPR